MRHQRPLVEAMATTITKIDGKACRRDSRLQALGSCTSPQLYKCNMDTNRNHRRVHCRNRKLTTKITYPWIGFVRILLAVAMIVVAAAASGGGGIVNDENETSRWGHFRVQ